MNVVTRKYQVTSLTQEQYDFVEALHRLRHPVPQTTKAASKRPARSNGPQFLDRSQIVERLHEAGLYDLDSEWVRSKMDQGHFPVTQIGPRGKRRVLASFVEDWIAKHAAQAAPSTPLRPHPAR